MINWRYFKKGWVQKATPTSVRVFGLGCSKFNSGPKTSSIRH